MLTLLDAGDYYGCLRDKLLCIWDKVEKFKFRVHWNNLQAEKWLTDIHRRQQWKYLTCNRKITEKSVKSTSLHCNEESKVKWIMFQDCTDYSCCPWTKGCTVIVRKHTICMLMWWRSFIFVVIGQQSSFSLCISLFSASAFVFVLTITVFLVLPEYLV